MKGAVLIGGGDFRTNDLDQINTVVASLSHKKTLLVIPYAAPQEKYLKWYNQLVAAYQKRGYVQFEYLTDEDSAESCLEKIQRAGTIVLTGGLPDKLLRMAESRRLVSAFKSCDAIIVGFSAGALVLGEWCIITKDEDYPKTLVMRGFGLVNFSAAVHYDSTQDDELLPQSFKTRICALSDGAAVFVEAGRIRYLGKAVLDGPWEENKTRKKYGN